MGRCLKMPILIKFLNHMSSLKLKEEITLFLKKMVTQAIALEKAILYKHGKILMALNYTLTVIICQIYQLLRIAGSHQSNI